MNLGRLVRVENNGNGRGSSHYNQLTLVNSSGDIEQLLLTDRELQSARERARKNAEDLRVLTLIDDLVALKIKLLSWLEHLLK